MQVSAVNKVRRRHKGRYIYKKREGNKERKCNYHKEEDEEENEEERGGARRKKTKRRKQKKSEATAGRD